MAGDALISIGADEVRDVIDFLYHGDTESVRARLRRNGRSFDVLLRRDEHGAFGIVFEPLRPTLCSNRCVFCFIDQLPEGLRESLYVRDEDYRLSFLHGNFITMTNLDAADLKRIIEQRLSPLYVSVHATNPEVRARMLGTAKGAGIMPGLKTLKRGGIQVHAQIVLCPGINDGAELEKTVSDLASLFPSVRSIAVVPVGLTKFREGLVPLRSVDRQHAARVIESVEKWQKRFLRRAGTRLVFAADEFYLLSGSTVPSAEEYEDFPQMENGIGIVRKFLEGAGSLVAALRGAARGHRLAVLTGKLAEPVCADALSGPGTRVLGVTNQFFGESVTVSGLLAGRDILATMRTLEADEIAVICGNSINEDGLFLDGTRPAELEALAGRRLIIEGVGDGKFDSDDRRPAQRGQVDTFQ